MKIENHPVKTVMFSLEKCKNYKKEPDREAIRNRNPVMENIQSLHYLFIKFIIVNCM